MIIFLGGQLSELCRQPTHLFAAWIFGKFESPHFSNWHRATVLEEHLFLVRKRGPSGSRRHAIVGTVRQACLGECLPRSLQKCTGDGEALSPARRL